MSWEQLGDHAAKIQQSAIIMDLRQRGFGYDKGRVYDSSMTDEQVQTVVDITAGRFAGVAAMFDPFIKTADPAGFDRLSERLATEVAHWLNAGQGKGGTEMAANPDLGRMDDVKNLVEPWFGAAAVNFRDNFLSKWPGITANQFLLIMILKGAAEAEAGVWRAARASIDDIAHKAQAALDAMLDCNPKDLAFLLTVAGSIGAVGGFVTTGGLSLTLTVLGEVSASAGAIPFGDKKELPFSGKNAMAIVNAVQGAITELIGQVIAAENKILESLNAGLSAVAGSSDLFIAPRPALADATPATIRDETAGLGSALG
ncbi:hypothetical protein AB0M54_37875 [Actinoplanes sp. NPDC051470]|uniref:hypothetical protein n=1 Tax=Actinoplanes sp. NPDC051470 TaxID=3157224 RepID=UPI00343396CD